MERKRPQRVSNVHDRRWVLHRRRQLKNTACNFKCISSRGKTLLSAGAASHVSTLYLKIFVSEKIRAFAPLHKIEAHTRHAPQQLSAQIFTLVVSKQRRIVEACEEEECSYRSRVTLGEERYRARDRRRRRRRTKRSPSDGFGSIAREDPLLACGCAS